ncbi:hypothetical protein H4W30_001779 [Amycolatopsis roodepoortensis]|uniref:Uncharacterized protein n=1 Tax=Amycolatopsis roodepoortensis TaxID=700274 RepID=A0ABR9L3C8_9PSEU|nr:hypothetical protein [Amycolatopsis roodepoortensis]
MTLCVASPRSADVESKPPLRQVGGRVTRTGDPHATNGESVRITDTGDATPRPIARRKTLRSGRLRDGDRSRTHRKWGFPVFRRTIAAVSVVLATAFGLTVAADSSAAGTVTQTWSCHPRLAGQTVHVTVTAPAVVKKNVEAAVFVKVENVRPYPGPGCFLRQGGAGTGEVKIDSRKNPATIPIGGHFSVEGTQQVTFSARGTVTLGLHRSAGRSPTGGAPCPRTSSRRGRDRDGDLTARLRWCGSAPPEPASRLTA